MKTKYIVTGMLKQGAAMSVRLIAEAEPETFPATVAEPNCEDAYMYCLYQNGCENLQPQNL